MPNRHGKAKAELAMERNLLTLTGAIDACKKIEAKAPAHGEGQESTADEYISFTEASRRLLEDHGIKRAPDTIRKQMLNSGGIRFKRQPSRGRMGFIFKVSLLDCVRVFSGAKSRFST